MAAKRPAHKPLPDDVRASILDMHAEGATRRDIALAHGVSTGVVSKIVHAAGLTFPGNNGTRAATLARQLDLADWHDQKALELDEREGELLTQMVAMDPRATGKAMAEWEQVTVAARKHREAAQRARYAATLRDMPDADWPGLLSGIALQDERRRLKPWEWEVVSTEFMRRAAGVGALTLAEIDTELSRFPVVRRWFRSVTPYWQSV